MKISKILYLTRKELIDNKKLIIAITALLFIITTIISAINTHSRLDNFLVAIANNQQCVPLSENGSYKEFLVSLNAITLSIYIVIMAALAMRNYNNKQNRTVSMMLPASIKEKFFVKYLFYAIIPLFIGVGVLIFGDYLRVAVVSSLYGAEHAPSTINLVMGELVIRHEDVYISWIYPYSTIYLGMMLAVTLSFLSTVIWRKYSLLYMIITLTALVSASIYLIYKYASSGYKSRAVEDYISSYLNSPQRALSFFSIVLAAFIIIFVTLAYKRFKENEVIDYKW